ncbi:MAG: hypothetical protein P4L40_01825 [Terracidiphilus sp.]|nr:hypothetical protein [Terracidiphilus sp.]
MCVCVCVCGSVCVCVCVCVCLLVIACARGAQFFLFTDIIVYANTGAFSSMYTMHRVVPIDGMTVRPLSACVLSVLSCVVLQLGSVFLRFRMIGTCRVYA